MEDLIRAEVLKGRFESEEELVADAVRAYLRQLEMRSIGDEMGSIGGMRDAAEDLDRAIEHVMKVREGRPWRMAPGE